jgi:hypothetical protein
VMLALGGLGIWRLFGDNHLGPLASMTARV